MKKSTRWFLGGLAFGADDRLYALESMTQPGFPGPGQFGSGRVVQIDPDGTLVRIIQNGD